MIEWNPQRLRPHQTMHEIETVMSPSKTGKVFLYTIYIIYIYTHVTHTYIYIYIYTHIYIYIMRLFEAYLENLNEDFPQKYFSWKRLSYRQRKPSDSSLASGQPSLKPWDSLGALHCGPTALH